MSGRLLGLAALAALLVAGAVDAAPPADLPDEPKQAAGPRFLFGCEEDQEPAPPIPSSLLDDQAEENEREGYRPGTRTKRPAELVYEDRPTYLNGIGSPGRCWELTSDTAFGNRRVLTQRVELARALKFPRQSLSLVIRLRVGGDASIASGAYAIQGLSGSLGVRHQVRSGRFSLEAGLRVVPGWGAPNDSDPEIQALALDATLTSGVGSDAFWLPFSTTGLQLYTDIQTRTGLAFFSWITFLGGARYGGEFSLFPMEVRTWLGPQSAFISNVYLEFFFAVSTLAHAKLRAQLGIHADASLSSIWPGNRVFPIVVNGFVGWSPSTWLSMRIFAGIGGSAGATLPWQLQYGLRLQFYVP